MRRGEVRWYRFSRPDKRRPVLVLTRDPALEFLGDVTVAAITSMVRSVPSEVLLTPADGMPRECAVDLYQVHTVAKGRVGPLITTLRPERMSDVRSALLFALGF